MMSSILLQHQAPPHREVLRQQEITRALRQSGKRRNGGSRRRRRAGRGRLFGRHANGGLAGSPPGAGGRLLQL